VKKDHKNRMNRSKNIVSPKKKNKTPIRTQDGALDDDKKDLMEERRKMLPNRQSSKIEFTESASNRSRKET
jgi:hypothetical protein